MPTIAGAGDQVDQYCTAYGTSVISTWFGGPGAAMCNMFYDDVIGWCNESGMGLMPTARYCWYGGLPGHPDGSAAWGWIICVILTGGYEFDQDPGAAGYSMSFFDSSTGPLLCYAGSANMGTGFDSNGQEDAFDIYIPTITTGICGTYWFGGYPNNFSSWWLELYGPGVPGTCTWYCGAGTNYDGFVVVSPANIGGSFVGSVSNTGTQAGAFIAAYSSAATLTTPWGQLLINIADPNGELSGNPSAFGNPAVISAGIPPIAAFMGFNFFVQACGFGGGLTLHCAFDCIVGV
jgi:hypothetical protein